MHAPGEALIQRRIALDIGARAWYT